MSAKRLNENDVINNVISICKEISTNEEKISFLGFVGGEYVNCRTTRLILHNSKTGETWETTKYSDFINYKPKGSFRYSTTHQAPSKDAVVQKILKVREKENLNWDFSEVEYINNKTPIKVICNEIDPLTGKKHGAFYPTTLSLLHGSGCPKCSNRNQYTTEEFIEKAVIIHNGFYNYDKTVCNGGHNEIIVTCPKHGDFITTPTGHLIGKCGCPKCNNSFGELEITKFLDKNSISYTYQERFNSSMFEDCPNKNFIKIDFTLEFDNRKIWIEYNGEQHYHYISFFHENTQRTFSEQIQRDLSIRNYALENGIEFLEIPYLDIDRIPEILRAFLFEGKDITTKIERDDYSEDF